MGRLLCLDYGRKRVGVAVTDPLKIIASGLETIPTHQIREYMKSYLKGEDVDGLIVGYPKTVRNEPSEAVQYINPFVKWFEAGVKKMARQDKSLVDKVSASLILQSYMDSVKNMENRK